MCPECLKTTCPPPCPNAPDTHPVCPQCGDEAEVFYRSKRNYDDILGCDICIVETESDGAGICMWGRYMRRKYMQSRYIQT